MLKILIVGNAGFMESILYGGLLCKDYGAMCLDKFTGSERKNVGCSIS